MTLKAEGESSEGFPSLSSTMPSAFLRDGVWKPVDTRGARWSSMMFCATLLITFQTGLGVLSRRGAENGEERASTQEISASESSRATLKGCRMASCGATS